ncbi:MAG TPA: DCC1-like thiol-disulfide oxidoreductase family protein [Chroococcidiopsis sp.]
MIAPEMIVQQGLFYCLLFGVLAAILATPKLFKRFVGEATPATLGVIRILACICMLVVVLWIEDVPTTALFPEAMYRPFGMMQYLYAIPGFHAFARSQLALQFLEWGTALCLFLGLIGWRSRLMVFLGALGGCVIGGLSRQYLFSFFHQGIVPFYMLFILSATPCGDGLSVDRLIRLYQGKPVPESDRALPIYAWSRYACWVFFALAYMASGTSKIKQSGIHWLDPTNLRSMMYSCTLQHCNNYDWDLSLRFGPYMPDFIFTIFGLVGTVGEILFILVLFSALARWIMPPLMVALHVGILFFQNIIFVEFVVFQLMFVNYTKVRQSLAQRVQAKRGSLDVFYDGASPACNRSVRVLKSLDLFNRINWLDRQQLDLARYNSAHGTALTAAELDADLHVRSQGQVLSGYRAYGSVVRSLPALWWMVPFFSLPALSGIGTWLHRNLLVKFLPLAPEQAQAAPAVTGETGIILPVAPRPTGSVRYPLLISALTMTLFLCWFYRFYFYPLTGLHLFAYRDVSGVILYNQMHATYASGKSERIYPEEIIPAQAVASPRRVTNMCFEDDPSKVYICDEYLRALGSVHNRTHPDQPFTQLELQQWRWSFLEAPFDTNHGSVIARHILEI